MTAQIRTVNLPVEGMTCASCVRRVEKAIAGVPGVSSASVNLATNSAEVGFDDPAAVGAVRAAVAKAGYSVPEAKVELNVEGATCASCVRRIETALQTVPGVEGAAMNLATGTATVSGVGLRPETLAAAVAKVGYTAVPMQHDHHDHMHMHGDGDSLFQRFLIAAALTLPVFVLEMGGHLFPALHHWIGMTIGMQASMWIQMVLTTLVMAFPGRVFLTTGIPALLRGAPEMNALVALGAGAAWLYSVVTVLAPALLPPESRHIYFEAAALIVTLILMGRWLEARAKGQAGDAIRKLVGLAPKVARVERDGAVVELPVAEVRPGDLVHLRPGERVAVDGEVAGGESWLDEAMLTGEPAPVAKRQGDAVSAGTVNTTGALTYRATAVGAETRLSQIVRMVEAAQGAKLPVQNLVDRITAWFVPAVIVVALVTTGVWLAFGPSLAHAVVAGVSVLIIACPCAMGLAVPVSIMVGTGRGAELGVLFRRGDALQVLSGVDRVVFDKTGTLTEGHPVVTDLIPAEGVSEAALLADVAAVEALSEHPLARAVVKAAGERGLDVPGAEGFASVTGQGAFATVGGRRVAVGNRRMMEAEGAGALPEAEIDRMAGEGRTPLLVAVDGRYAGLLAVADPVKEGAAPALAGLTELGVGTAMLTGDTRKTAQAIAGRLGIGEVEAEVMPEDKLAKVRQLQERGETVAFVGDGINDAPVLAGADVGIAIGSGTDVAIEAAEVVLMSGDPRGVARAVGLSRAVMRNIRENLVWAFGYNVLLIPVAAGVLYPVWGVMLSPALGAGAMALSSVLVVGNALRLRRFGGEK